MPVGEVRGAMDDDVRTVAVTCNQCGAALDLPPAARFVTCTHCGTRLEVRRTGGAAYTEILDTIQQHTQQIAGDVEQIRRQNDLEQLDREWELRRESLMVSTKHGGRTKPSRIASVFAAVVAVVFGVMWIGGAGATGAPTPMLLFGLLVVGGIVVASIFSFGKAGEYEEAERDYQRRRQQLRQRMDGGGT